MNSNFPSHWQTLPFEKAVADVTAGNTKLQGSEYSESGVLPIIDQGQEFIGGYTNDMNYQANVSLPTIIFGDHTRVFKYVDFPFCLGADGTKILEPKVNLDKKFLFHYLKSLNINSAGYSRHYKFLKENVVPVPPLEEQKRIAAILDKADTIRRKRQEAIKLADEFLRAVFLDMFGDPVTNPKGWMTKSIAEVAPFAPNRQVKVSDDTKVWLLNLDQVESNTGKVISKYICDYSQVGNSTLWFDDSHVLYCKLRPYLNKVVMPDSSGLATSELIPLKPNPEYLNREFLTMYLRSEGFVNWALNKVAGAKMPRLSTAELREHQIILPPIDLQQRFCSVFNKRFEINQMHESALSYANESFESLSQNAFAADIL